MPLLGISAGPWDSRAYYRDIPQGLPLGSLPSSGWFLSSHLFIKISIFHSVKVIVYVGFPNVKFLVGKWITLLDQGDIYILNRDDERPQRLS